jgi:hypothetical protein
MKYVKTALFSVILALSITGVAAAEGLQKTSATEGQMSDFDGKTYITSPNWAVTPSNDDIVAAYKAYADGRSGKVVMDCPVRLDGHFGACRMVVETPKGEGLADAALSLAPKFQMKPVDASRRPVAGRTMRMSLDFSPQT